MTRVAPSPDAARSRAAAPAADDDVGAQHAEREVRNVHASALAPAITVAAPEQLRHHAVYVAALGDGVAVAAVGAGYVIVRSQGGAGADRYRFLSDGGMA